MAKKSVKKKVAKKSESKIRMVFGKEVPLGKTTGLRVQEAWQQMFEANETAPKNKKKTDKEIADWMLREFPGLDSKLFDDLRDGVLHRVQAVRARYNRGGFNKDGTEPKRISHRYDSHGEYDDPKFSGKSGVTLDKLPKKFTRAASEDSKPTVAKKAKKKVVLKKKKAKAAPAAAETASATA